MRRIVWVLIAATLVFIAGCRKDNGNNKIPMSITGTWVKGGVTLWLNANNSCGLLFGDPEDGMECGGAYQMSGPDINFAIGYGPCNATFSYSLYSSGNATMMNLALVNGAGSCPGNYLSGTWTKQ